MAEQPLPYTDLWRVMQEMGALLDAMGELPNELLALSAALDDAHALVEDRALEECAGDG